MDEQPEFVWYASHPRDGELILVNRPAGGRNALIYSTRMVHERIGKAQNPLYSLELGLGPLGFISPDLYQECGITVPVPFTLRLIMLVEQHRFAQEEACMPKKHDQQLQDFMLEAWNARGKNLTPV